MTACEHRVVAMMWTYGRHEVAAECVRAILNQDVPASQVIVIDSASPDGTAQRLIDEFLGSIEVLSLPDNGGPGSCLATAIAHADLDDATHVWFVEDDSRPGPSCLADLLAVWSTAPSPAMVGPDGARLTRGQWHTEARLDRGESRSVDFVYVDGALVDSSVVVRNAPPRDDYFLMMVDVEYPLRLRSSGVSMVQAGIDYCTLRLGAAGEDVDWRTYYQTRNHLHMALAHRSPTLLLGFLLRTSKQVVYELTRGNWRRIGLRARGVLDALRGRMGRTVEPGLGVGP